MHLSSTLALLAVFTVPATSRPLPTTVVSSTTRRATTIATYFGEKARSLAQEQKQRRLMDSEFGDFGVNFGDGDATFGGLTFEQELCPFLSDPVYYDDDELYDDADLSFKESCDIHCDIAEESIVSTCNFNGQHICDDQGEFCIDDLIVTATVPFDFHGVSGEVCMTYTAAPADMMLQGKEGCVSMDIEMDFGAAIAMDFDPDVDAVDFGDAMQITRCDFTLGDEVCECDICENGFGGDLTCPDIGLISEECAGFNDELTNLEDTSEIGDIAQSIVRFTRMESEGGGLRR